MNRKTICILGLGYIGLPTALLLAKAGHTVFGYDIDKKKIQTLKAGMMPFQETGLEALYAEAKATFIPVDHPTPADVFIVATPTPVTQDKKCDMSYVMAAIDSIKPHLRTGNLVVVESTIGPRATVNFIKPVLEETGLKCGKDLFLSHVPEKAIPSKTIYEMTHNTRVIGGYDPESTRMTRELYASFVMNDIFTTDCTTAEVVKLFENTFRDVNIALANEFSLICKDLSINVWEAIRLANLHPRVNIHEPGPGVGGHCIAIDPWFLAEAASNAPLIVTARTINDSMPRHVVEQVRKHVPTNGTIAILGAAYKRDIDDTRESPALAILQLLSAAGYATRITDAMLPLGEKNTVPLAYALTAADCAIIATDHTQYRGLGAADFAPMKRKLIIDTRNCVNKRQLEQDGIRVITLGNHVSE